MLDNLILAYRNKFYDLSFKETVDFWKKNGNVIWIFFVLFFAFVATTISYFIYHTYRYILLFFLVELLLSIVGDRLMVHRHRQFISTKQAHIKQVVSFLKTAIPNSDLFCKKQVDELIIRLSNRIDSGAPLNKLKSVLCNFGKVFIFPIITYIAGLYSVEIRELEFLVVLSWAIFFVLIMGTCYMLFAMLAQGIQKVACRNHDAAMALKEDLLDIRMLFFVNDDEQHLKCSLLTTSKPFA